MRRSEWKLGSQKASEWLLFGAWIDFPKFHLLLILGNSTKFVKQMFYVLDSLSFMTLWTSFMAKCWSSLMCHSSPFGSVTNYVFISSTSTRSFVSNLYSVPIIKKCFSWKDALRVANKHKYSSVATVALLYVELSHSPYKIKAKKKKQKSDIMIHDADDLENSTA